MEFRGVPDGIPSNRSDSNVMPGSRIPIRASPVNHLQKRLPAVKLFTGHGGVPAASQVVLDRTQTAANPSRHIHLVVHDQSGHLLLLMASENACFPPVQ